MRQPKTFPAPGDAGEQLVRLWPQGPRWTSAAHITATEHGSRELHVWRVTTYDFLGVEIVYLACLVWPKVWHKTNPSLCVLELWRQGTKIVTPESIIKKTIVDLDAHDAGTLPPSIADADMMIDARDPEPPGQEN